MKRRLMLSGTFACASLGLASGLSAQASQEQISRARLILTAADVHPANYPTVIAVQWLAEQLRQQSNGELLIKPYHSGQLGRESDTVDLTRLGALAMTRVFAGGLNNAVPQTRVLSLPYLFPSVVQQRASLDGDFGAEILRCLETRQLKGLAIYDAGARHFYAHKAIRIPSDLRALKVRVPVSDFFIDLVKTLGANPTPLSYGAVYSALETGLIDAAENNLRSFHSSRHFETAKVLSMTAHSYTPDLLVFSLPIWQQLGSDAQQLLTQLARQSVTIMRQAWDKGEAEAKQALLAAKVQIETADHEAFVAACAPLLERYLADPEIGRLVQLAKRGFL